MSRSFLEQMNSGRRALLTHIATVRDLRVNELIDRARQESSDMLAAARRKARAQVHAAINEERHRRDYARQRAWGEMHAAIRREQYRQMQILLDDTVALLKTVLLEFWSDSTYRSQWLNTVIDLGVQRLNSGEWVIEHSVNWRPREADAAAVRLKHEQPDVTLRFSSSPDIQAGFRLQSGGVVLDGTLSGLFGDDGYIKGALLGMLVHMPGWPHEYMSDGSGGNQHEHAQ